jgi:hypothetical protein
MDTEQENTDQIEDSDLYDAAIGLSEPKQEQEAKEQRARDEKGRFAAKAEQEAEEAPLVVETQPEQPKEGKVDHRIPLTELLNEREKRQAEQRRAEAALRELEELRKQLQAPPKQVPDQFAQPEAYNEYWEQRIAEQQNSFQQAMRNQEANISLRLAHMQHGETFEQAYNALIEKAESGDRGPAQAVANSPDPGRTLVEWYSREKTLQEVGTDPNAYVQKKLEEALNDPQFLAKALEKARGVASTQPTQVKLPPSLNKAAPAARADDGATLSDVGLYHHSIGR